MNEDGQQLGIMSTDAARDVALRVGLDLVEISPNGRPPVCKIMDYGRYKYELKKKASSAKKAQHQSTVKEIKMRPRIDEHDLDFKLKNATRFLVEGDKVKCTVMFRGRENLFTEAGRELLFRVADMLSEVATMEQAPRREGRALFLVLAPSRAALERAKAQRASARAQAQADETAEPEPEREPKPMSEESSVAEDQD